VGRVLAEELAIRAQEIRLGKIVWADTKEAKQTAALLLNRLANRPAPSRSTSAPEFPEDKPPQPPEREEGETERPSHLARLLNRRANRPAPSRSTSTPESREDRLPQLPQGKEAEIEWPSHLPEPKKDGDAWRRKVPCDVASELSPTALDKTTENMATQDGLIASAFREMCKPGNALLIIGHQPQLGRLTACLTRRMFGLRRGVALPLSSSEILCLRSDGKPTESRWKLLWTIAPDDAGPLAELAEKVKGKMESAKLLSAVITLALAALLGTLLDTGRWDGLKNRKADLPGLDPYNAQLGATIAFVLLLTALAVYLVTMYSYDRLLMPTRFWGESSGRSERAEPRGTPRRSRRIPRRPPSSSAWVVYRNMQLIWFALFTPANVLVPLAFATLAATLLGVTQNGWWLAPLILAVVAFAWSWRPVLGSED
jgi:hypothetical protein